MQSSVILGALIPLAVCSAAGAAVLPLDKPAMVIRVTPGVLMVQGKAINIPELAVLTVDPPEQVTVRGEEQVLLDGPMHGYGGGTMLKETWGPVDATRNALSLLPKTLRVYDPADPSIVYEEGKDYILDHTWGGIARAENSRVAENGKIRADYVVERQRLDTVQVSRDGKVSIKKGASVAVCPEAPEADAGCTAIAHLEVGFQMRAVTADGIYPLPAEKRTWQDYVKVSGVENLSKVRAKLKAKQPVTVVCWGDSVTAGGSSTTREKSYVELFRAQLKAAYPQTPITLINAGIGGTSTDGRRAGFEKEVLSHNPDLITVEYVNDTGYPREKILANYKEFMDRARAKNPDVEFIIITPHVKRADWMQGFDESVKAMREAAVVNKAACADATNVWVNLRSLGIPYMSLLANGINHPNDLGHEFFAACLMKLMRPGN